MVHLKTFVFFDLETTGLPHQERNTTKITELSVVATNREDILRASTGNLPPISKLTYVLNPMKNIHPQAAAITGLSNDTLKYSPTFKQKANSLISFLEDLQKPVCLVAHKGNTFDYKILLAECFDAGVSLPSDLLCVDSLIGFRQLLPSNKKNTQQKSNRELYDSGLMTSDEDWPELVLSAEDSFAIDELCSSFFDVTCEESVIDNIRDYRQFKKDLRGQSSKHSSEKAKKINSHTDDTSKCKLLYSLPSLYKRLLKKEVENSHRAEDDCVTLLHCVVACKDFIQWSDSNCRLLTEIQPLQRKEK